MNKSRLMTVRLIRKKQSVAILRLLADGEKRTLSEIATEIGYGIATTREMLAALIEEKFVARQKGQPVKFYMPEVSV